MAQHLEQARANFLTMTNGAEVNLNLVMNLPELVVADIHMVMGIVNSSSDINHGRMLFLLSGDLDSSPASSFRSTWLMFSALNPYVHFRPPMTVAGNIRCRAQNFTGQNANPSIDVFFTRRKVRAVEWADLRFRMSSGG